MHLDGSTSWIEHFDTLYFSAEFLACLQFLPSRGFKQNFPVNLLCRIFLFHLFPTLTTIHFPLVIHQLIKRAYFAHQFHRPLYLADFENVPFFSRISSRIDFYGGVLKKLFQLGVHGKTSSENWVFSDDMIVFPQKFSLFAKFPLIRRNEVCAPCIEWKASLTVLFKFRTQLF